ncbi:DUF922 domain-containing protein [Ascidiimonas sp. W6]|uniref:DUF922 domain-containing protein n=1 Tax=Ascidiimonas meishanensis TaxID=3128903 RepID=UPI0030EC1073
MRCFIFLLAFCLVAPMSAQEESIKWSSSRKLSWKDFKGAPEVGAYAAAITASGISYEFSATIEGEKVLVDYQVNSYFFPKKSWFVKELADVSVLRHEQLHFDITELHARKMRTILSQMKFTDKVRKEIKTVYNKIIDQLQAMQKQYDAESDFSRNPEGQLEWEAKIAALLKQYKF